MVCKLLFRWSPGNSHGLDNTCQRSGRCAAHAFHTLQLGRAAMFFHLDLCAEKSPTPAAPKHRKRESELVVHISLPSAVCKLRGTVDPSASDCCCSHFVFARVNIALLPRISRDALAHVMHIIWRPRQTLKHIFEHVALRSFSKVMHHALELAHAAWHFQRLHSFPLRAGSA